MRSLLLLAAGLAAGCGVGSLRTPTFPKDAAADEAREVFRAADEFLAALRAGNWDRAAADAGVPFLIGDWSAPRRIDDRGALPGLLQAGAEELGGPPAFGGKAFLATPLRADEPAPPHLAREVAAGWPSVLASWTAVTGPGVQLVSAGDPVNPAPVKLLVRVADGKAKVVGVVRVPSAFAGPAAAVAPPAP